MKYLGPPAVAGDVAILDHCAKHGLAGYQAAWLAAAQQYRDGQGDPWQVAETQYPDAFDKALRTFWANFRKTKLVKDIRKTKRKSCLMCGSAGGRSVDHGLPRVDFPEFAILFENLVPACTICNSDEKGAAYKGDAAPKRFIHPYYDVWANDVLWLVHITAPYDAAEFRPEPMPHLPPAIATVVQFHLDHVLGDMWKATMTDYWGSLPLIIRNRVGAGATVGQVTVELTTRLGDEVLTVGENGWLPAMLRGVLADPAIAAHLLERMEKLPALR